jgi:hypothetical protein
MKGNAMRVFIPDNDFGIPEGYYSRHGIVALLRKFRDDPRAVQFIADMLEYFGTDDLNSERETWALRRQPAWLSVVRASNGSAGPADPKRPGWAASRLFHFGTFSTLRHMTTMSSAGLPRQSVSRRRWQGRLCAAARSRGIRPLQAASGLAREALLEIQSCPCRART